MRKIIITEDIMEILERERSFLQRSNIQLYLAATNRLALYMHEAEKADLIIANLDSEAMSAEELCSIIRQDPELQKVSILIVSRGGDDDMARIKRCRANAFIQAPLNPIILLGYARQLLEVPTRLDYRAPVSVKVEGESEKTPFLGETENISASGMLITTDKTLEKGELIECSFFLPDTVRIHTPARIVRSIQKVTEFDPFRYGVQFSALSEALRAAIEQFVRSQKSGK